MTTPSHVEYTDLVQSIAVLVAHEDPTRRNMHWVREGKLGVARTIGDGIELFVLGAEPRSRVVTQNSRLQAVYRKRELEPIPTLCVSLPPMAHFDPFAAFICSELDRIDTNEDLRQSFRQVEPLLELAFARHLASASALTAFIARLLTLEAIIEGSPSSRYPDLIAAWVGSRPWRDLSIDSVGAIVRGIDGFDSIHHIANVAEVTASADEEVLLLVSIGVTWQPDKSSSHRTAVEIVDYLGRLLEPHAGAWRSIVEWMEGFRRSDAFAYTHETASTDPLFTRPFAATFNRSYELANGEGLLTSADIELKEMIIRSSVTYSVSMPTFADDRDTTGLEALVRALNARLDREG